MNMKIGYIRSLKHDDFYETQLNILHKLECERIFEDIGESTAELDHLADYIRENDIVYIYQLDRFGLNVKDLMKFTYDLLARNVSICSVKDSIDTSTAEGEVLFKIFNALSLCEQNAARKEVSIPDFMKGASKASNVTAIGRPKGLSPQAKEKAEAAALLYQEGNLSMREIATNLNISTATLYSYLRHERVI